MSRVSPDSLFFPALALAPIVRRFRQQRCAQQEKNKSRLPRGGGVSPGSRMPKCRLRTRGRQGICLVFGSHDMCGHNLQSSEQHGEGLGVLVGAPILHLDTSPGRARSCRAQASRQRLPKRGDGASGQPIGSRLQTVHILANGCCAPEQSRSLGRNRHGHESALLYWRRPACRNCCATVVCACTTQKA